VPVDLRRSKGWVGQLLERYLGASAGSRAEPDFPYLGIELKSVPVDRSGRPRESTYVCTAPLDGSLAGTWQDSWARRKLQRVLWMPVVGEGAMPVAERLVGAALLWSPSDQEEAQLCRDWEELAELIQTGDLARLDAHTGEVLQLRPKAASSKSLTWMLDEDANWIQVNPRGFYLRRSFTTDLLARHLRLPGS
jgi:DNA mismatch repair protein MutH